MDRNIRRIYVEKLEGFDIEAKKVFKELRKEYSISRLDDLRIVHRYDTEGLTDEEFLKAKTIIFSEPNVDKIFDEELPLSNNIISFAVEYLPGQFDQRADSASQCLQMITGRDNNIVSYAKVILIEGTPDGPDIEKIKSYFINPVEAREASREKPISLKMKFEKPERIKNISGFIDLDDQGLKNISSELALAMSHEDISFCQAYFRDEEKRDPTITEIRVIDTYWSDHCRHTTFLTRIENVEFEEGNISNIVKRAYADYLGSRKYVYQEKKDKPVCLMDIATIVVKHLKKDGYLEDLDESDEINACSIVVDAKSSEGTERWFLMFKNETHNHPTEIEPFGGAATCLGGAIRDPLSGRAYVYQAMRVTGSGDPNTPIKDTIPGKLPQRTITKGAADGYSSYGNQIGLATGQVNEIYHEGYVAKRMEIGAVVGAAPIENVKREKPLKGDVIILLGGRTGRDGCGGATGSSKEHDEESLVTCSAEVQKGNPPTERKIQRLFRRPEVTRLIKKCNDFGAGGISVAIGELTDGLEIYLDKVPKKYEGLNGTELAISESQERMAVVVEEKDAKIFIDLASEENLEATIVAEVTETNRMRMHHMDDIIVDLGRDFLNSNGAEQYADVTVKNNLVTIDLDPYGPVDKKNIKDFILGFVSNLNICSQKGLIEQFDSTIGAGTVLMPFGGKYQLTPEQGMAALFPSLKKSMSTASLMTFGYDPNIFMKSPFHGAVCSIVESVSKIVALGADYTTVRLTFQEYFERLSNDPIKWAKPFSALLGAYHASMELRIAAIGGKDSMSGTFKSLDVPPTVVSFAVATADKENIRSSEFKKTDSAVYLLKTEYNEDMLLDFNKFKENLRLVHKLIIEKKVRSVRAVSAGGVLEAILKMSFGNKIGFAFIDSNIDKLTRSLYGSFVIEADREFEIEEEGSKLIGYTKKEKVISIDQVDIDLEEIILNWTETLESTFKTRVIVEHTKLETLSFDSKEIYISKHKIAKPKVFIPVFPGTNCEYDSARRFEKAGGEVQIDIFKNLNSSMVRESVEIFSRHIKESQIIMIPGGFSAGDEPEGSGKFIATVFRNELIKNAINEFLEKNEGMILGICNGFQALIKLGLLPYGEIRDLDTESPTLTFNSIGRHVSCIAKTRISSNKSPWLSNVKVGELYNVPVSHGEGRFFAKPKILCDLITNGQIATQYVDMDNNASYEAKDNPNGSIYAVEGITSMDGKILGKMGHSERIGDGLYKNIHGDFDIKIFEAGINYFK